MKQKEKNLEEKKKKRTNSSREVWGNIKWPSVCITGVSEEGEYETTEEMMEEKC